MYKYTYLAKNENAKDTFCIYPDFHQKCINSFPVTKELIIDYDGYCTFHIKNRAWSKQNNFA